VYRSVDSKTATNKDSSAIYRRLYG
jgi:hypothetical protein